MNVRGHIGTLLLLGFVSTIGTLPTRAQDFDLDARDNNLLPADYVHDPRLPEWCDHTFDGQTRTPDGAYIRMYGEGFRYVHHHCRGMFLFFDASKVIQDPARAEAFYRRAVEEFTFVLRNTDATFVLRPEVLTYKGMALVAIGNPVEAFKNYEEAVAVRPDYVPGYVAMTNLLLDMGERAMARTLLADAVTKAPGSEVLRRRLAEIDSGSPPSN